MLPSTPTFPDVLLARRQIRPYLHPTPLYEYPALSQLTGARTWVKHENHQPVGNFKVRGGVNLLSQMPDEERRRGVISASTGNHGQSICYAARLFGVKATICVPENANPVKVESMLALGARVLPQGRDFDAAREFCEQQAREHGYRYIHSGNEPLLIAGVATATLEALEEQPGIEILFVPVGGGSGAAGACLVAKTLSPRLRVIGVQAEAAQAAYLSWKQRRIATSPMNTRAEGLATGVGFELPQQILCELLDDFLLVSEEELRRATYLMIEKTRNLVEPAGAAALAGALRLRPEIAGRTIGVMCSGGNLSPAQAVEILWEGKQPAP